jgi:hypothetical protein
LYIELEGCIVSTEKGYLEVSRRLLKNRKLFADALKWELVHFHSQKRDGINNR